MVIMNTIAKLIKSNGPNNTFKQPPDHPVSPRGLASDMSVVVALLPYKNLI